MAGSVTATAVRVQSCPWPAALDEALAALFGRLTAAGAERFFHPHPLTYEEAERRGRYRGQDVYCVLTNGANVWGYGMLRGWDEGYEIPSLGIAIDPHVQGRGLGRILMEHLHAEAWRRGASRVRLTVHAENRAAISLYRTLGYEMAQDGEKRLVGFLERPEEAAASTPGVLVTG